MRDPGNRDEKKHVKIHERRRPSDGRPQSRIVGKVPEGERPQEGRPSRSYRGRSKQCDRRQHDHCGSLAADLNRHQGLGNLGYGFVRLIELLRSPDVRQASGVAGQQTCRSPQVHHYRSFNKAKCGGKHSDYNQLPSAKETSCAPHSEGGCQWNEDQHIDPPRLRPNLKLPHTEAIVRGVTSSRESQRASTPAARPSSAGRGLPASRSVELLGRKVACRLTRTRFPANLTVCRPLRSSVARESIPVGRGIEQSAVSGSSSIYALRPSTAPARMR